MIDPYVPHYWMGKWNMGIIPFHTAEVDPTHLGKTLIHSDWK